MKTKTTKLAYEAPEASVDWIVPELNFVATTLPGFEKNSLYEEEFDE